jgi:hypothetical protein
MPPRRARNFSGNVGVRARPAWNFYAEIRTADHRIGLRTFKTVHKAACVYNASAWHLGRPGGT